jgi:hypothetical protein
MRTALIANIGIRNCRQGAILKHGLHAFAAGRRFIARLQRKPFAGRQLKISK